MGFFSARCPVDERERAWIDENMDWFGREFGSAGQTVLPTAEYFPHLSTGSDDDVRILVHTVAGYMRAPAGLEIRFSGEIDDGAEALTIDRSSTRDPVRLIAVIAHELGRARLLGEGRVGQERRDHEPLTDLVTVHLGMGIFTANAAFDFKTTGDILAGANSWRAQRMGYMTEQMFGYALARYAVQRGEPRPSWAKFLDTNPRAYMRHGLRFLAGNG